MRLCSFIWSRTSCRLTCYEKRIDRKTAELAETAGMLHDYAKYINNQEDDHAKKSAECAQELLKKIPDYSNEEIHSICQAISNHSKKQEIGSAFDEILKDADEIQHYFRNPVEDYFFKKERIQKLLVEFGIE